MTETAPLKKVGPKRGIQLQQIGQDGGWEPRAHNSGGRHPVLFVCEHASAHIPKSYGNLGLEAADLTSHIAWDPGAFDTVKALAGILDAPLVYSTVSRLLYDCNRPPEAASAVPERSENTVIPGNIGLSTQEKDLRVAQFYRPFEMLVSDTLDKQLARPVLVTVHSYTPVFKGQPRSVEIGIVHDDDSRLADAVLQVAAGYEIGRNEPYGPADGVTHTLRRHALPRNILNVMLEIRNDLISTPEQCAAMGRTLADWLSQALILCAVPTSEEA